MLMSITNLFPFYQVHQLYFSTAVNVAHMAMLGAGLMNKIGLKLSGVPE